MATLYAAFNKRIQVEATQKIADASPFPFEKLSPQQQAIIQWARQGAQGHVVVRARAGTGKTFTTIQLIQELPGGAGAAEAVTAHALGFRAIRRYWEKISIDNRGARQAALAEAVCGQRAPDPIKFLVAKLNTKARELKPWSTSAQELYELCERFDCQPDEQWVKDGFDQHYVCDRAAQALLLAAAEKPIDTGIDFADMLFLPLVNGWLRPTYDYVIIDEAQDWTPVQLALVQGSLRPGGRIVIVGDDRQAIYGFRGADSNALDRLKAELQAEEYGLTVTYRCGKNIVARAQRLVPDYQAAPDAHDGIVRDLAREALLDQVAPKDFVLSRINAPLVSVALGLIRRGTRAKIEGRDIGAGLRSIVRRLAVGPARNSIPKFLERLETWRDREIKRARASQNEAKADAVHDQYETLQALADGAAGIPEIEQRLLTLFADDVCREHGVVVCSSVHKAKGLETERVFMLVDTFNLPAPCVACRKRQKDCKCVRFEADALAQREEANLEYVAITRAKQELVRVIGRR